MDNVHQDMPPKMSDGRNFVNYQPAAVVNETLRRKESLHSNWTYRKYLQANADAIRSFDWTVANRQCSNYPLMNEVAENRPPKLFTSNDPYGMSTSDLKNDFYARALI